MPLRNEESGHRDEDQAHRVEVVARPIALKYASQRQDPKQSI
jgi:hypothetical protein